MPPLPQRGAHSPAQPAARSVSSCPARRAGAFLPPAYLRGRLGRFSPDPSSSHSSHTPPLVPHSLSLTHTHSATTAPERPTYYASLACYVLCARARAETWREAGEPGGGVGRGENVGASGGTSKRSWEMKFRVLRAGKVGAGATSKHLPSALASGIRSFL